MILKPRGTTDFFDDEMTFIEEIKTIVTWISKKNNFHEIQTPIFEYTDLFKRKNESSDMVLKQMYVFNDKSGRSLVLRPENTASVIRAVVENKLLYKKPLPLRYFYFGPMFRYERPQSGRMRQFHQYGVENIATQSIMEEVEIMIMANDIIQMIGLSNYVFKINYIGNLQSRTKWILHLKQYFSKFKDQLSKDSLQRLEINPLRILDDKEDGKKDFVINAPMIDDFLSEEEKAEISFLKKILKQFKINFEYDNTLVRGLDYYNGIVFEIDSLSHLLQGQSTLIGGGRYSGILQEFDEPDKSCFGFALGIERVIVAMKDENYRLAYNTLDVYLANLIENDYVTSLAILRLLRHAGISSWTSFNIAKLNKHFQKAEYFKPKLILIYGQDEAQKGEIIIKNQKTNQEIKCSLLNIQDQILEILSHY